jgi:hypothetical protein
VRGRERRAGAGGPACLSGPGEELGRGWKKKRREGSWAAGLGRKDGLSRRFGFVFFLFLFQIHFKPISNPFKFKSFTSFQILTQISPTIFNIF